ncbi:hypothetical protein AAZX31_09G126000 [Glycine max]|uniref:Uncharacterized protein n=2 Tax=Glycine subgen. Soja TaxID=1462606 RepID=A0A0R0I872_SOYBN|nr:hypothetical protein JHK87_025011 [Glycine soja]KAG5007146.1 hypothetical protein JHK85_025688 [Glycine max]KAG5012928.1 hypothetical protein JHK86_025189 [Glycine max]KAG5133880.1 hypothetical protein JHK82_025068 [Glycine max]KAH1042919.1 hypothetical protein GYH30_024989 [Glycine max]
MQFLDSDVIQWFTYWIMRSLRNFPSTLNILLIHLRIDKLYFKNRQAHTNHGGGYNYSHQQL